MFIFSVAWISVEAFEFLCGQNQETWADRKLKQVLTLFFHTVPSLSSSTYTDTNSGFPSNFFLLLFHFFLPLSLHSTKILRQFGKSTSLWLSPGCVCGCAPVWGLLGLSWKEKDGSAVIYCSLCTKPERCFLQESLQSFTPQSSPSPFSNDTNAL